LAHFALPILILSGSSRNVPKKEEMLNVYQKKEKMLNISILALPIWILSGSRRNVPKKKMFNIYPKKINVEYLHIGVANLDIVEFL